MKKIITSAILILSLFSVKGQTTFATVGQDSTKIPTGSKITVSYKKVYPLFYNKATGKLFYMRTKKKRFELTVKPVICKDCGEIGCIYETIDDAITEGDTQQQILKIVTSVCKENGVTNKRSIALIFSNFKK